MVESRALEKLANLEGLLEVTAHSNGNGRPAPDGGLTTIAGAPVVDNNNVQTAGPRGPMLLQDVWYLEKLAHFDREVIPERRMHAKGSGVYGTFTVTNDITRYTTAKFFSAVGKQTGRFRSGGRIVVSLRITALTHRLWPDRAAESTRR